MILELDCGNSFIKWRLNDEGVIKMGLAGNAAELIVELEAESVRDLRGIRLVSVRDEAETRTITEALSNCFGMSCSVATPSQALGGVRNGYSDYRTLGMDRWLAIVGAYSRARKACLILDLGTAITADFVTGDGLHLGGFICPGIPLMRSQLQSHTGRIRYAHAVSDISLLGPGQKTAEAVERGCLWMIRGFIHEQATMATRLLGSDLDVFLTGGDAHLVLDRLPSARCEPDLVFAGLALACPIG